ncbi:uncharacterized protein L3040_008866 [Drepanopeziza brunnea f. sp. 'multigermtubi']|uniref:uncharacterized protein n=1 Tax=Drepanopeziza brunnea f. sp. 'multigermtubi' TaxID=698441 RepID=UPI002388134C|nr:hypothetical protein L3040_008866 [Drepanopeziza brunnea f. sp. 'multigermtubi']
MGFLVNLVHEELSSRFELAPSSDLRESLNLKSLFRSSLPAFSHTTYGDLRSIINVDDGGQDQHHHQLPPDPPDRHHQLLTTLLVQRNNRPNRQSKSKSTSRQQDIEGIE